MIKKLFCLLFFFYSIGFWAQQKSTDFRSKNFTVANDTIQIDTLAINSMYFKVLTSKKEIVPAEEYIIDFSKAEVIIDKTKYPEITVEYYRFPEFLTKVYTPFDKRLIVPNDVNTGKLYSATTNKKKKNIDLLEGLQTQGFISRGLTSGNNQNAVTNSSLDLNITGKLSKNIQIRAKLSFH